MNADNVLTLIALVALLLVFSMCGCTILDPDNLVIAVRQPPADEPVRQFGINGYTLTLPDNERDFEVHSGHVYVNGRRYKPVGDNWVPDQEAIE
jgi:hypothetical protein